MAKTQPIERACKWDRNVFTPTRSDAKYCSAECRKAAFRYRKRHARDAGPAPTEPGLSSETIREELQEHCDLTGRPMPAEDLFLMAFARTKEAEEQVRRWSHALKVRREQLQRLPRPAMAARVVHLTADAPIEFPQSEERYVGVSCSSPQLAIVVYGRKKESAEE